MEIQSVYDRIANQYDNMYTDEVCKKEDETIFRAVSKILYGKVLDIGCGTGYLPRNVDMFGHEYTGIDISAGMIEVAKAKCKIGATFIVGDFLAMDTEEKYNTVISTFCAGSYMSMEGFVNKIEDLISPSGLFFVMLYGQDRGYPSYYTDDMKDTIEVLPIQEVIDKYVDGLGYYLSIFDDEGNLRPRAKKGCSGSNLDKKVKYYVLTNYDLFMPKKICDFIRAQKRTFAKTYADKAPHEYIVREKVDDRMFVELAMYIRNTGYKQTFRSRTYSYMNFGKMQYWTMGNPIDETTVLNRAYCDRCKET